MACSTGLVEVGSLALDDGERDAVDEQDDVGPAGLVAAGPLDGELLGDVEDVVPRFVPVDVAEREALGVALDRLGEALAQGEQVVELLVGPDEPVVERDS